MSEDDFNINRDNNPDYAKAERASMRGLAISGAIGVLAIGGAVAEVYNGYFENGAKFIGAGMMVVSAVGILTGHRIKQHESAALQVESARIMDINHRLPDPSPTDVA